MVHLAVHSVTRRMNTEKRCGTECTRRTNGRSRIRFLSTEERTDTGSISVILLSGEPVPSNEVFNRWVRKA